MSETPAHQTDGSALHYPELVKKELAAICASEGFVDSKRLRQFLTFVVSAALDGKAQHLKETVIGVEIYQREATYSPKADPIVRTEARRLRTKLHQFYSGKGAHRRAVISLPVGGYVPRFELREENEPSPAIAPQPSLPPTPAPATAAPAHPTAPLDRTNSRLAFLASALALALLLIILLAGDRWLARMRLIHKPSGIRSIAVLPILNLSGDPQQDHLADGMTEELIGDLVHFSSLRVISRTSVMQFKGVRRSLPDIAAALNVDAVVEGSLLRDGTQVRMVVQLLDARRDRHLWARTYEKDWNDIYSLPAEVTTDIGAQIQASASPAPAAGVPRHLPNPQAQDLYLRGKYFSQKHTPEAMEKTIALYQQAIQADPNYAQAYASLAGNYIGSTGFGLMPVPVALAKADEAALKAARLDSSLAGVHGVLALTKELAHWDWAGAEAEYRSAISFDDRVSGFHASLGTLLSKLGRTEEALREGRRAVQLEPLSLEINTQLADSLYLARHYDEAIEQARNTLAMEPRFFEAAETLAEALHQKGRDREALAVMEQNLEPILDSSYPRALLVVFYASSGQKNKARELLQAMQKKPGKYWISPCDIAIAAAALGDRGLAAQWLDKAYQEHDTGLTFIKMQPLFDPLRADPRFQNVLRRMRFP